MKQNGDGSIINYGSTAAVTTNGSGPIYCASKAAVINTVIFWMFAKNFELWWSEWGRASKSASWGFLFRLAEPILWMIMRASLI